MVFDVINKRDFEYFNNIRENYNGYIVVRF